MGLLHPLSARGDIGLKTLVYLWCLEKVAMRMGCMLKEKQCMTASNQPNHLTFSILSDQCGYWSTWKPLILHLTSRKQTQYLVLNVTLNPNPNLTGNENFARPIVASSVVPEVQHTESYNAGRLDRSMINLIMYSRFSWACYIYVNWHATTILAFSF